MKNDPLAGFYPDWVNNLTDADVRPLILKLGKTITDRAPIKLGIQKVTKYDPEYWAVAILVPTDEMAQLCLNMGGIHKPKTFPEICAANPELKPEKVQEMLETLSYNGVLEWNYENDKHEKQWVLPMFVPGSGEFSNMNKDLLEAHPELGRFFERMTRIPLEGLTHMVPPGGAGIGMHVIPVEKAIALQNNTASVEHISHWLDKYDGKYAAAPCSCRMSRKTFDEGCADDPEGWCVAMGDMADYVVETNKGGRYITREEALDIFRQGEENGFVHQITNIDGEDKIFAICNCNINVCYALRTSQLFNTPNMSRSAHVAKVLPENCVACGRCVEYCPAGAVKLGRKLCKKDGSQATYPKMPLPTEVKWSEAMWNENYRDDNRISCYDTGTAPCKAACPAHIAIQGYLRMAAEGRYTDALALIKKENPFPAVCGRVCNRRCEDACTRGTIDEAIAIDEVKRFIAQQDLDAQVRFVPKKVIPSLKGGFDEKVAIIGAGPAGLSCAFYLAEKGYKPTVFEKNSRPGGMLRYGIPSFVLEKDVIDAEIDVMRQMGVEIKTGVEIGKNLTLDDLRAQGYKAFYIAIGCQGGRRPGVPNDNAKGTYTAVDFLHQVNESEQFDVQGDVVVIGGGNVAIDVARCAVRCVPEAKSPAEKFILDLRAKVLHQDVEKTRVHMFCLEQRDQMPASRHEVELVEAENVSLNCGWGPKEVLVDEQGAVNGIVLKKCIQVKDAEGRFAPLYDENDTLTIECRHIIFSVGQAVEWGDLLQGSKVQLGRGNGAVADALTYQTAEPDIFVGGDVYTGPKFAIDAIAAGKQAAISIHRFVQPHSSLTIGRDRRQFKELDKSDIRISDYDHSPRQIPGKLQDPSGTPAKLSFRDQTVALTEEQIRIETARCLKCGASVVDENKCIGCGVCTTKCEFDAIHLYRDNPDCSTMRKSEDKLKYILPYGAKQAIRVAFKKKK
ncbi:MAG: FAD-dependent oxidoreductase [Paludibacteraceae bacterium]|nr:FAD-dependent oxidoreductase [Paludibacteraceae bacterium]